MDKTVSRENFVIQMMNMGFSKAVDSFSRMVGKKVTLAHSNVTLVKSQTEYLNTYQKSANLLVLTTQMIGELTGKSYFILSDAETAEIAKFVYRMPAGNLTPEVCQAVLLEIDNIISASVIGQVSNSISKEVYGDVPALQQVKGDAIQTFIKNDFSILKPENFVVLTVTFNVEAPIKIHPQFIWKLSSKVFEMIPNETLVYKS
jgi:chemotaxis protein CheY-P-specific phosphatase CheC